MTARPSLGRLALTAALWLLLAGCDGGADGDADADSDVDTDADADTDADGDGEPDGDAEPDGDVETDPLLVDTTAGPVRGHEEGGLRVFLGIPYAAPPVGDLRLRPPRPHPGWSEALEASSFGPICPQEASERYPAEDQDEDCLTLNVWAPVEAPEPLPVMVWIHGGGFVQGSSSTPLYDGANLASTGPVVVVSINYRLGALGFLATEALATEGGDEGAGNYGLLDQIAALEWVRDNVAPFGGDPAQVTIFGESAGGSSVCVHLGSPLSEGLFARAIIESGGGCVVYPDLRESTLLSTSAIERGEAIAVAAGCDGAGQLACLRGLSVEELLAATPAAGESVFGLSPLGPNVDGVLLPDVPYDMVETRAVAEVPVVTGSNADEMQLFTLGVPIRTEAAYQAMVRASAGPFADELLALYPAADYDTPKDAYVALTSDLIFICPALAFASMASAGDEPAFTYHFTHGLGGALATLGAFHGLEIAFVFGNFGDDLAAPTEEELELSAAMTAAWLELAAGAPAAPWTAFDPAAPAITVFDTPISTASAIRDGHCEELRALGLVR